jgi:hypothetical protein
VADGLRKGIRLFVAQLLFVFASLLWPHAKLYLMKAGCKRVHVSSSQSADTCPPIPASSHPLSSTQPSPGCYNSRGYKSWPTVP